MQKNEMSVCEVTEQEVLLKFINDDRMIGYSLKKKKKKKRNRKKKVSKEPFETLVGLAMHISNKICNSLYLYP